MNNKVLDVIIFVLIIILITGYIGYNWYQTDKLVEQYAQQVLGIKP